VLVSPILVRPVREQFEHDRVIRALQARYKRKYEVAINPGAEQNASVAVGDNAMYPDLVLFSQERSRRLQGTIEVETTESINTLEAMAEWGPFSRLRAPFFLYVPPNALDTVRRLCAEHNVEPAEIWTYHTAVDQVRFTMVHQSANAKARADRAEKADQTDKPEPAAPARAAKAAVSSVNDVKAAKQPARPMKTVKAAKAAKAVPPRKPAKPAKAAKASRPAKSTKAAKPSRAAKKAPARKPVKGKRR
jgi:hypothetical protein